MKTFIVERDLPGIGKLTPDELKAIAEKTNSVIHSMGKPCRWIQTFVTDKKLYCIHVALDCNTVLEHSQQCGFPVNYVDEVTSTIDPDTSV